MIYSLLWYVRSPVRYSVGACEHGVCCWLVCMFQSKKVPVTTPLDDNSFVPF